MWNEYLTEYLEKDEYPTNAYQGSGKTALGWSVAPKSLYYGCKFIYRRYKLPIIITENGMAGMDWISVDGKVHDPQRIDYTTRYLRELYHAIEDGIPVIGYQPSQHKHLHNHYYMNYIHQICNNHLH